MKANKVLVLFVSLMLALVGLAGCTSSKDEPPAKETSQGTTQGENDAEQDEEATEDDSAQDEAAQDEIAQSGGPTREEIVAQKDTWAEEIMREAMGKLYGSGAVEPNEESDPILIHELRFEPASGGDSYVLAFADKSLEDELTGSFELPDGKVVICDITATGDSVASSNRGHYVEAVPVFYAKDELDDLSIPLFLPEGWDGHTLVTTPLLKALASQVPTERFANSFDDCAYLIAVARVPSCVEEDFYNIPASMDRVTISTLAIVVDVQKREVVHIEDLGSDTPGAKVEFGETHGEFKQEALADYLVGLLA